MANPSKQQQKYNTKPQTYASGGSSSVDDGRTFKIQAITESIDGDLMRLILPGQGMSCIIRAIHKQKRSLCERIVYNGLPLAAATSALAAYVIYMSWHYGTWGRNNVEGPTPLPILGNWFYKLTSDRMDDVDIKRREEYGNVYGVYESRDPILVVGNPKLIKEILYDHDKNLLHLSRFQCTMPESTMNRLTKDSNWKMIRSIMKSNISGGKLQDMRNYYVTAGKNIAKNMEEIMKKVGNIDMKLIAHHFTLDVLAGIGFGMEMNSMIEKNEPRTREFTKNVETLLRCCSREYKFTMALKHFFPFFNSAIESVQEKNLPIECKAYFLKLVEDEACKPCGGNSNKYNFLLKHMAKLTRIAYDPEVKPCKHWTSKGFTYEEVAAQMMLFIQNSYGPIVSTLTLICYYLTEFPNVQKDVINEIDSMLTLNMENNAMNVGHHGALESVVNEVLRLHPPAVRIERTAINDFSLSDGTRINKNMKIRIPIKSVHLDEEIWSKANKFDPSRFLQEDINNSGIVNFLPFGGGQRSCMGESLAREAIFSGTIYILLNHELATYSPLDSYPHVDQYGIVESNTVLRKARDRQVLIRMNKASLNANESEAISIYSVSTLSRRKKRSRSKTRSSDGADLVTVETTENYSNEYVVDIENKKKNESNVTISGCGLGQEVSSSCIKYGSVSNIEKHTDGDSSMPHFQTDSEQLKNSKPFNVIDTTTSTIITSNMAYTKQQYESSSSSSYKPTTENYETAENMKNMVGDNSGKYESSTFMGSNRTNDDYKNYKTAETMKNMVGDNSGKYESSTFMGSNKTKDDEINSTIRKPTMESTSIFTSDSTAAAATTNPIYVTKSGTAYAMNKSLDSSSSNVIKDVDESDRYLQNEATNQDVVVTATGESNIKTNTSTKVATSYYNEDATMTTTTNKVPQFHISPSGSHYMPKNVTDTPTFLTQEEGNNNTSLIPEKEMTKSLTGGGVATANTSGVKFQDEALKNEVNVSGGNKVEIGEEENVASIKEATLIKSEEMKNISEEKSKIGTNEVNVSGGNKVVEVGEEENVSVVSKVASIKEVTKSVEMKSNSKSNIENISNIKSATMQEVEEVIQNNSVNESEGKSKTSIRSSGIPRPIKKPSKSSNLNKSADSGFLSGPNSEERSK